MNPVGKVRNQHPKMQLTSSREAEESTERRFRAVSSCGREWDYRAQISLFARRRA